MKLFIYLSLIFLVSCATLETNKDISIPEVKNNKKNDNTIKSAVKTKFRIGEKNGYFFDFYYGPKGTYFIVVTSASKNNLDLSNYDISLSINNNSSQSPEVISLAVEDEQVLSGAGELREGQTNFNLALIPTDSSISFPIIFNFHLNMIQIF